MPVGATAKMAAQQYIAGRRPTPYRPNDYSSVKVTQILRGGGVPTYDSEALSEACSCKASHWPIKSPTSHISA